MAAGRWSAVALLVLSGGTSSALSQAMPSQEQMMRVGSCMANLDPAAIEAMERKGEAFQAELGKLCKAGQRDAALQRARQFGLEMADDPAMKQIKACTAGLAVPQQSYEVSPERLTPGDICSD